MILTGTTLITFFATMAKPVKSIQQQAETAYQERIEKEEKVIRKCLEISELENFLLLSKIFALL